MALAQGLGRLLTVPQRLGQLHVSFLLSFESSLCILSFVRCLLQIVSPSLWSASSFSWHYLKITKFLILISPCLFSPVNHAFGALSKVITKSKGMQISSPLSCRRVTVLHSIMKLVGKALSSFLRVVAYFSVGLFLDYLSCSINKWTNPLVIFPQMSRCLDDCSFAVNLDVRKGQSSTFALQYCVVYAGSFVSP